jgi:hypothetical protein
MKLDANRVVQRFLRRLQRRWDKPLKQTHKQFPVKPLPKNLQEAAALLVDRPNCESVGYKHKQIYDWDGVHPDIIEFTRRMVKELKRRGIPFYAFELMRTAERQKHLLRQKRSKAGPWESPHQYGCAVDLISYTRLWNITPQQWLVVGTIGKEIARKMGIKVVWGGDWKFYDPAHWQLADWKEYKWMYDREGREITSAKSAAKAAELNKIGKKGQKIQGDPSRAKRYAKYAAR